MHNLHSLPSFLPTQLERSREAAEQYAIISALRESRKSRRSRRGSTARPPVRIPAVADA